MSDQQLYRIVKDPNPGCWPFRWPYLVVRNDITQEIFTSVKKARRWIERQRAKEAERLAHPPLTSRDMPEVWREQP